MKEALDTLLPRMNIPEGSFKIIDHGSKQALLNNLPSRLRGYAKWDNPSLRVLVLVDRDADDCKALKQTLEHAAASANLLTKTKAAAGVPFQVANRIVVEELEAWFFGDTTAMADAYPGVPSSLASRSPYRDPDAIKGGTWEALGRVLHNAGYYTGSRKPPKIEVARNIAAKMQPNRNRSHSFQMFANGLRALMLQPSAT